VCVCVCVCVKDEVVTKDRRERRRRHRRVPCKTVIAAARRKVSLRVKRTILG